MIRKPANTNRAIALKVLQVASVAVVSTLGWQALQTMTRESGAPGFVTASVEETGPILQIVFTDTARLTDVSALLLDLDGRMSQDQAPWGFIRSHSTPTQPVKRPSWNWV